MDVVFKRTGPRRYAVIVRREGAPVQYIHPAPGYDDDIPHDLVHYVVEAELGLRAGVFGRALEGGGTFWTEASAKSARERAREQRRQKKREQSLRAVDEARGNEMVLSERIAGLCDVAFRRRRGQRPDPLRVAPPAPTSPLDSARVERVVARLEPLADAWRNLPVGGELVFTWPNVRPLAR